MLPAENLDNKIKELWPKNGPSTEEVEKYVKKYSKEKIVIKCGGRVLLDSALFNNFIEDIAKNLESAKKLGMKTVWLINDEYWGKKDSDKNYIDLKIENLSSFLKEINILKAA